MNQTFVVRKMIAFALVILAISLSAFILLPWMATLPSVRGRIEFNKERKIDGGATFYTDQDFLMDSLATGEGRSD